MKKIFALLLAFVMIFSFAACGKEEPQNEDPKNEVLENDGELIDIEPNEEEEPKQTKEEFYEEMLLNFGAKKDGGKIRVNKTVSLYNMTDGFEDGTKLDENDYFCWAMFYFKREYDYEKQRELFTGAGENNGWAYPSEYYEPAIYKYFGVPKEVLRGGELYNAENDYYHIGAGGGVGISPAVIVNSIDETDENVVFHITIDSETEGFENYNMALTVKLLPDGGYNYASYLPE